MRSFLSTIEAKRWLLTAAIATVMSLPLAVSAMVDGPSSVSLVETGSHTGALGGSAASVAVGTVGHSVGQSSGKDADRTAGIPSEQAAKPASRNPVSGLEPGTLALMGFGLLALFLARRNAR